MAAFDINLQKRCERMSLYSVILPLFTHVLPMLFFVFMGVDVWIRNPRKTEHRLVGITALCFVLLFMEEYVRHQLPIAYSPWLSTVWFSSVGIAVPLLAWHLFVKFARWDLRMPKYVYPYVFYLPMLLVLINIALNGRMLSVTEFTQQGIWKVPVFNTSYYITLLASLLVNVLMLVPLLLGKRAAATRELREIFNYLILGVSVSAGWVAVFGLIDFQGHLPPYPYLYGEIFWCAILRHTMKRYDFMTFSDKRYEKLFNLNPAAIVLMDLQGQVKEANPSARQLFESIAQEDRNVLPLLTKDVRRRIERQEAIRHVEMPFGSDGQQQREVLIDGDYLSVEYEPHLLLIMRDITLQKRDQREIMFLAYHDSLTRLPNRRYFHLKLEEAIRDAAASQAGELATVLIDVDRFKEINDKYGHQAGDEVLQLAADIIRDAVGNEGMAARLGGDEFVVFLYPVSSRQAVYDKMTQLRQAFERATMLREGQPVTFGISLGASFYPEDGETGDTLLNQADKAMYRAKIKRRQSE